MKTRITEMLGIEFPVLAFSHRRDVVAAVSKAGGMHEIIEEFIDSVESLAAQLES